MLKRVSLLVVLGMGSQLSAQIFGPGVIHTGTGNPVKITAPATSQSAPSATVIINPPAPPVTVVPTPMINPAYGYGYPYQPFGPNTQQGLPMHTMAMNPGYMYARPMYVQPTAGSMIIITPPRVHSMMPARAAFGR